MLAYFIKLVGRIVGIIAVALACLAFVIIAPACWLERTGKWLVEVGTFLRSARSEFRHNVVEPLKKLNGPRFGATLDDIRSDRMQRVYITIPDALTNRQANALHVLHGMTPPHDAGNFEYTPAELDAIASLTESYAKALRGGRAPGWYSVGPYNTRPRPMPRVQYGIGHSED